MRCWSIRDMSKVQGPDEGDQRTHLPPATKVEMSEVRQGQDAEAKGEVRFVIHTIASWRRAVSQGAQRQPVTSRAPLNSHLRRRVFGWLPIMRNNASRPKLPPLRCTVPGSRIRDRRTGTAQNGYLGQKREQSADPTRYNSKATKLVTTKSAALQVRWATTL